MQVTSCGTDPLIHHGRHFGQTVHALCSIKALITNGLLHMGKLQKTPEDKLFYEYVHLSGYSKIWLTSMAGNVESILHSRSFCGLCLASKSDSWKALTRT